jgi:DNA polymerase III epsilon subunit-like protein
MKHLNGNILAVVDCETTGVDPMNNEIIEICIAPVNFEYKITAMPFHVKIKPERLESIDFEAIRAMRQYSDFWAENVCKSKDKINQLLAHGMDKFEAADLLAKWFEDLKLPPLKRIMPIAHNWVFDSGFISQWIGTKSFEYIFDPRYRDTMAVSLFLNDLADMKNEQYPYPKNNLQYLCSELKVERTRAHTALDDAVATAEVYRRLLTNAS